MKSVLTRSRADRCRHTSVVDEFAQAYDFGTTLRPPCLPTRELLCRAKGKGYTGGKTAFYEMVHQVRPKKTKLETRFKGVAGEFSQHDFGEFTVRYVGGSGRRSRSSRRV